MTFGITSTGFNIKKQSDILDSFQSAARGPGGLDPQIEYGPEDPLGQLFGIVSSALAEGWEQLQEVYGSNDIDAAEDVALANLGALLGISQGSSSPSKVYVLITASSGTIIPQGTFIAQFGNEGKRFYASQAFTADGTGHVNNALFLAEFNGPVQAAAGSLTVIVNPIAGWTTVTNFNDAQPGQDVETAAEYRQSIKDAAQIQGGSTVGAIRADILALNDSLEGTPVKSVTVSENVHDFIDQFGVPGKSFEAMIFDEPFVNSDLIAQTIWDSKPATVYSHGNQSGTATDGNGDTHSVNFSRPLQVPIYVELTLYVDLTYVGDVAAMQSISDKAHLDFGVGVDVIFERIKSFAFSVPGVRDLGPATIHRLSETPLARNVLISNRQISSWNTTQITLTVLPYVDQ